RRKWRLVELHRSARTPRRDRVCPGAVISNGDGCATDQEQIYASAALAQLSTEIVQQRANLIATEADAHTRCRASRVMNTPRLRNDRGASTRARGCIPRRSVTNHHGVASSSGSRVHAGGPGAPGARQERRILHRSEYYPSSAARLRTSSPRS